MSFTEYDDMTGVFVAKLILEELRLIRSEIKEEIQKLAFNMKIFLMRQSNTDESKVIRRNCEGVIQTVSDLNEPVNDFFNGSLVLGDGLPLEDTRRNDCDLNESEKVSTCTGVKLDVVNYILNSGDTTMNNDVPAAASKKKDGDCVNDGICDFVKEKSEQTSFVSTCTTLEPNSSSEFDLDVSCVMKYDPCRTARSHVQNPSETSAKAGLIQLKDGKVPEKNDKKHAAINDRLTTMSTTNSRYDKNKKNREKTPENANISIISKLPRKNLQVYTCQFCSKTFKFRSIANHLQTHTGERPYKCDVCSKRFRQKSTLKVHYRTHTGEKPYKCDMCLKGFYSKSNLVVHCRTHTGEKPFKCEVCSKGFTQGSNLKVHYRTHTGERPFKCDICLKEFREKCTLSFHSRIHRREKTVHI